MSQAKRFFTSLAIRPLLAPRAGDAEARGGGDALPSEQGTGDAERDREGGEGVGSSPNEVDGEVDASDEESVSVGLCHARDAGVAGLVLDFGGMKRGGVEIDVTRFAGESCALEVGGELIGEPGVVVTGAGSSAGSRTGVRTELFRTAERKMVPKAVETRSASMAQVRQLSDKGGGVEVAGRVECRGVWDHRKDMRSAAVEGAATSS